MTSSSKKNVKINMPRVTTAIGIVVCVLLALYFGDFTSVLLFGAITLFGTIELKHILGGKSTLRGAFIILAAFVPWLVLFLADSATLYMYLVHLSVVFMLVLIVNLWVGRFPYKKIGPLFSMLYWGLPFGLLAWHTMDSTGIQLSLFGVILIIWISDTFAYFTGKAIGKTKLLPSVSPGKTIEGSLGGGLFSILVALLFAKIISASILQWVVIATLVWVIGTLGDLVESKIKRTNDVKDSGSILPGHGGFLDRFDSLVMVIPFLLLLKMIIGFYN